MQSTAQKQYYRQRALITRAKAHRGGGDLAANMRLCTYLDAQDKKTVVAGYMPTGSEISPLVAMKWLIAQGWQVCVPVVKGNAQPLEFRRWTPSMAMKTGHFGVSIPDNNDVLLPDIVITPLLLFDLSGYRLGYGGGYYDRTFAKLKQYKAVYAIGLAYSEQEISMLVHDFYDYRLDGVMTSKQSLFFN